MASDVATLMFGLFALFIFFVVCFMIFLVIRQFVLWYWRINEIANNIAYIADFMRGQEQVRAQARPGNSPFAPPAPKAPSPPNFDPYTGQRTAP